MLRSVSIGVAVCYAMLGSVFGHHAMEFIEIESYSTAMRGEAIFHLHFDYMVDDNSNPDLDHWEITPGLSYGITDRLMIDVHTHFAKFGRDHVVEERQAEYDPHGPSPFMEAVALAVQYRMTEGAAIDVAVAGTWEIPFDRAESLLGSEDYTYAATLILNREFGTHGSICANFIYEIEGSEYEWGWAVGVKAPVSSDPHGVAAGVEFTGDFDGERWSILPGLYMPINEMVQMKTGLEFGQEQGDDDEGRASTMRANVTLMYRF